MRCDVKVRVVLEGAVGDSGIWLQMLDLVEELLLFMLEHASSACERELGVARQETPPIEFQRPLLRLNYLDAWELLQQHLEYRSTEPMGGMTCVLIRYSCWNCGTDECRLSLAFVQQHGPPDTRSRRQGVVPY